MDHRISKDMISSGMIPSGEKNQEDLSRTQYGTAPSPNALSDVYKKMYETKEEVINEMAGKGMGMTPAPKPQGITPAKRVEKRNLPKPQDPATSKPQKDFIKARMSDSPSPKPETEVFQGNVVNAKTGEPLRKASTIEKVRSGRKEVEDKKGITARREKVQGIMNKYGESVDLLAAYRAVYEHHKKDADGNTIPHEGDEINEALPLIGAALKPIMGIVAKKGLGAAVKTVASKAGSKIGGSMGRKLAYKAADTVVKNPINTVVGAQMVGNMIPKPSMPVVTKKQNQGGMVSAGADLFDIVKGKLLDEGLSEEEIRDIMLTLTPDEILSEVTAEFVLDASKRASAKSTMLGRQGDKQGMMDKGAQAKRLYDASAKKRREGNFRQGASAQGPSRIPTGEA